MAYGRWFWLGFTAICIGVALHLPEFFAGTAGMQDMGITGAMAMGMVLIAIGTAVAFFTLTGAPSERTASAQGDLRRFAGVDASGGAQPAFRSAGRLGLSREQFKLVTALVFAIAIDAQKPFTFVFILPSVATDYGLPSPSTPGADGMPVAVLPFSGILGTLLGSFVWGHLSDRFGRRPALLFAAVLFVGTSICGAMPSFAWNVAMCFIMGLGAGGMLPSAYSLLAETMPTRVRGYILVLVGGLGSALGFVLASWSAWLLMPMFGWGVMWLVGAPTGLLLLVVGRVIPESPRYLLSRGRRREAAAVFERFGVPPAEVALADADVKPADGAFVSLLCRPFRVISVGLVVCSVAWGLTNFGFLVWLPSNVKVLGIDPERINSLLAQGALLSLPGTAVVAWLYVRWSSRNTVVSSVALASLALGAFAIFAEAIVQSESVLVVVSALLLMGVWALNGILTPYSTEVYPTRMRARGAALVAGTGKLGGVAALFMAVLSLGAPGLGGAAWLGFVPMVAALVMLFYGGVETSSRSLEQISVASSP